MLSRGLLSPSMHTIAQALTQQGLNWHNTQYTHPHVAGCLEVSAEDRTGLTDSRQLTFAFKTKGFSRNTQFTIFTKHYSGSMRFQSTFSTGLHLGPMSNAAAVNGGITTDFSGSRIDPFYCCISLSLSVVSNKNSLVVKG